MEAVKDYLRTMAKEHRRRAEVSDSSAEEYLKMAVSCRDSAADFRAEAEELDRVRIAMYGDDV